jgi:hypothetical protein
VILATSAGSSITADDVVNSLYFDITTKVSALSRRRMRNGITTKAQPLERHNRMFLITFASISSDHRTTPMVTRMLA